MFFSDAFSQSLVVWIDDASSSHGMDKMSTIENRIWSDLLRSIQSFYCSQDSLPEEQFRIFWALILKSVVITRIPDIAYMSPEFKMSKLKSYEENSLVDIALVLKDRFGDQPVPFFIGEVAASKFNAGQRHKDYEKMATEMLCALLSILGLLKTVDIETKKSLIVYGAYMGRYALQWCIIFPVYDSNGKISFVFQTDENWTLNMLDPCKPEINFSAVKLEYVPQESHEDATIAAGIDTENAEIETYAESIDSIDWKTGEVADNLTNSITDSQKRAFGNLVTMGRQIGEYAKRLHGLLKDVEQKDPESMVPLEITKELKSYLPPSRDAHNSKPGSPIEKTPGKIANQRNSSYRKAALFVVNKLGVIDKHETMKNGVFLVYGQYSRMAVTLVTKQSNSTVLNEIIILKKFSDCDNVVKCIMSECDPQLNMTVFVQERLFDVSAVLHNQWYGTGDNYQKIVHTCNYILDGLNALEQLKRKRILHRDISPNNFMYSYASQSWKLIDFEYAVELNDLCDFGTFVDTKVYGTDGFIAPEVLERYEYSFAADMFSFGKTAYDAIAEPCVKSCIVSDGRLQDIAFDTFTVCWALSAKDVRRRQLETLFDDCRAMLIDILTICVRRTGDFQYVKSEYVKPVQSLIFTDMLERLEVSSDFTLQDQDRQPHAQQFDTPLQVQVDHQSHVQQPAYSASSPQKHLISVVEDDFPIMMEYQTVD